MVIKFQTKISYICKLPYGKYELINENMKIIMKKNYGLIFEWLLERVYKILAFYAKWLSSYFKKKHHDIIIRVSAVDCPCKQQLTNLKHTGALKIYI